MARRKTYADDNLRHPTKTEIKARAKELRQLVKRIENVLVFEGRQDVEEYNRVVAHQTLRNLSQDLMGASDDLASMIAGDDGATTVGYYQADVEREV